MRYRLKWSSFALELPPTDSLRVDYGDSAFFEHYFDARVMYEQRVGDLRLVLHPTISWRGQSIAVRDSVLAADAIDARRKLDLAFEIDSNKQNLALVHIDRLSLAFRRAQWSISIGRQPMAWGNGRVFQALDLFNPYAPTAVDREFRASNDSILVERLFDSGMEVQLSAIARRDPWLADNDAATYAFKSYFPIGFNEFELLFARHYQDRFGGFSAQIPIGGSVVRSDVGMTCDDVECETAGLLNVDYTFGILRTPVYCFAEYFHNDIGLSNVRDDLDSMPSRLATKLERGEVFGFGRDYLAFGTNFPAHPLWSISTSVHIALGDGSYNVHAFAGYEPNDSVRLQAGVTLPRGSEGDEYGTLDGGTGGTSGGGASVFLFFSYYR